MSKGTCQSCGSQTKVKTLVNTQKPNETTQLCEPCIRATNLGVWRVKK